MQQDEPVKVGSYSRNTADAGGALLRWNEAEASSYTHVVASHRKEPVALLAAKQGKEVVSLLWLWECLLAQRLLPIGAEQVWSKADSVREKSP